MRQMGRLGSHLHFFGLPTVALVAFERNQTQQVQTLSGFSGIPTYLCNNHFSCLVLAKKSCTCVSCMAVMEVVAVERLIK